MLPAETSTGFLEFARQRPGADRFSEEDWQALGADAQALGLVGLLVAACCDEDAEVDPSVRDELSEALDRDLRDALGETDKAPLSERMDRFVAAKGERGGALLARTVARVAHEVYDLAAHSFVADDALAAGELMAWAGPGQDARETARHALRVSRRAARSTLGHLDSQLDVVHALSNEEIPVDYADLDRRLADYAPRIFGQRLPSLVKSLVLECRRFRFVFVFWARLRGIVIGRSHMIDLEDRIDPRDPLRLVEVLMKRREVRATLRQADAASPEARRIQQAFLARTLDPL